MQCIDFLKPIYDVFQYTLIKDTTSEDYGLLFIPFIRLRTCCTLCNKGGDQSSCFCCNSSKVIGWFYYSTNRRGMKYAMRKQGFWQYIYKYVKYIFRMCFFQFFTIVLKCVSFIVTTEMHVLTLNISL